MISESRTPENAFLVGDDFVMTACIMTESLYAAELNKCVDKGKKLFSQSVEKFLI